MDLQLQIVEGPGAGRTIDLGKPIVFGRDATADIVLDDSQVSRLHARVTPVGGAALVEDLDSTNGTFINNNEVMGRAELSAGDELLIGVTVLQLLTAQQVRGQESAVRPRPPALATPERRPTYVDGALPEVKDPDVPELTRLVDARTKSKATLAPLAVFVLAALVVVIYLGLVD